ncbi:hypothetical protein ACLOJK_036477 [Asimina triloba]
MATAHHVIVVLNLAKNVAATLPSYLLHCERDDAATFAWPPLEFAAAKLDGCPLDEAENVVTIRLFCCCPG